METYYTELCTHLYEMAHIFSYPSPPLKEIIRQAQYSKPFSQVYEVDLLTYLYIKKLRFIGFCGLNKENYTCDKENTNTKHTYS